MDTVRRLFMKKADNSARPSVMAQRRWKFELPVTTHDGGEKLSFYAQLKKDVEERRKNGDTTGALFYLIIFTMVYHSITELYAFTYYITPYIMEGSSPMAQYYFNVLIWFIVLNMLANWFAVMLYDSSIPKTKDNPFLQMDRQNDSPPDQFVARIQEATNHKTGNGNVGNGYCAYDMTSKEAMAWEYCEKCQMHIPFRAHHCIVCKRCVLKRDHHCYMMGTCIGFKNQRYFIVLSFYVLLNSMFTGIINARYVSNVVWPELSSAYELILPWTIWRWISGSIKGIHCILISHMYIHLIFGGLGFLYFNSQMTIAAEGKTLYEVAKKVPIKNTNTINRNFQSVFGALWGLNFLFPMTLVLSQRDDGIFWDGVKIDHNANEKKLENGHAS